MVSLRPDRENDGAALRRTSVQIHQPGAGAPKLGAPETAPGPRRLTVPAGTFHTAEEFLNGLRKMQLATCTSYRMIEQRTEKLLPRATAHNMVHPQRTTLPARPELVAWFVKGCGGSSLDAKFWVDQWRRLREQQGGRRLKAEPAAATMPEQLPELPAPFEKLIDLQPRKRTAMTTFRRRVKRIIEREYVFSLKTLLMLMLFAAAIVTATIAVAPLFAR